MVLWPVLMNRGWAWTGQCLLGIHHESCPFLTLTHLLLTYVLRGRQCIPLPGKKMEVQGCASCSRAHSFCGAEALLEPRSIVCTVPYSCPHTPFLWRGSLLWVHNGTVAQGMVHGPKLVGNFATRSIQENLGHSLKADLSLQRKGSVSPV